MQNVKKFSKLKQIFDFCYKNLFSIFAVVMTAVNIPVIYQKIFLEDRGHDEWQHMHIAWNIFNGDLTLYKDFFDHHGPLYSYFNAFVLSCLEQPASFDSFIVFRHISFLAICATALVLFFITKKLSNSIQTSIWAVAIFFMWEVVQKSSIDIRPDILQNFFVALGIFFFIKQLEQRKNHLVYIAGLCIGIAIAFNFKVIIVLAALSLYVFLEFIINKDRRVLLLILYLFLGAFTIFIFVSLFFLSKNAFQEFLYFFSIFNFDYAKVDYTTANVARLRNSQYFLEKDIVLTTIYFMALVNLDLKISKNRLLLILSLVLTVGLFIGLFPYYALIFLPYSSIVIAIFLNDIFLKYFYTAKFYPYLQIFIVLVLSLLFGPGSITQAKTDKGLFDKFINEKQQLDWVLKNIDRSEPMSIVRLGCMANSFNKDFRYFWVSAPRESKEFGAKLAGVVLREALMEKDIKLFFAYPYELNYNKPLKRFIEEEYQQVPINSNKLHNCVWLKKDSSVSKI